MEFEVRLKVLEVRMHDTFNKGVEIQMRGNGDYQLNEKTLSRMFAGQRFLSRRRFAPLQDTLGRFISFRFRSRRMPTHKTGNMKGGFDYDALRPTDLQIVSIEKTEVRKFNYFHSGSERFQSVDHLLHLKSFGGGDGIHPSPIPDPYFSLKIFLNGDEYQEAVSLPTGTIFRMNFVLF